MEKILDIISNVENTLKLIDRIEDLELGSDTMAELYAAQNLLKIAASLLGTAYKEYISALEEDFSKEGVDNTQTIKTQIETLLNENKIIKKGLLACDYHRRCYCGYYRCLRRQRR